MERHTTEYNSNGTCSMPFEYMERNCMPNHLAYKRIGVHINILTRACAVCYNWSRKRLISGEELPAKERKDRYAF